MSHPSRPLRLALVGGVAALAVVAGARGAVRRGLLTPAAPAVEADLPAPPAPPASSIAAPVRLPLSTLVAQLEEAVPTRFGSLADRIDLPDRERTSIAFELTRNPFRVTMVGGVARLEATIGYALRAWYDPPVLPEVSASCGTGNSPRPRLRIVIEAPITVADDWSLSTQSRVVSLARASDTGRDRCTMTFLDFDVTDRVIRATRSFLEDHTGDLDSAAARVDLRSRVAGWWRTLQEPIRLTDSLWVVFRPETIGSGSALGSGDSLEITLALRARPGVVMGARPELAPLTLPDLDTGVVANGLDLTVDALAGYDAVTAFLQGELGGMEVERAGRTVRLDSLRVFGIGGGRLALEVVTSGDVVSRLFLAGTPRLNPATGQFSVPDLDYDFRTRSVMVATLSWLGSGAVRQILRERASWPATPAVGWLRSRLLEGLNRDLSDELRVAGEVEEIEILGIHAMRDMLLMRASATGSARLFVLEDSASDPASPGN
jgi:hypothetical protein